jgi:hypothetical protein
MRAQHNRTAGGLPNGTVKHSFPWNGENNKIFIMPVNNEVHINTVVHTR